MNYDSLARLIDGDAPAASEMLPSAEVSAIPIDDLIALLPGVYYMDPPDGGDVSVLEQLRRMSVDASQYRTTIGLSMLIDGESPKVQEILKGDLPMSAFADEVNRLHEENQRLRNAIEIIEHTLATLRGEK